MSPVFAGEAWRGGGRACISRPTNCTPARRVPRMLRVPRVVGSLVGWAVRARSAFWCWFQPGLRGCVLLAKATGVQGGAENTAPRRQLKKKKTSCALTAEMPIAREKGKRKRSANLAKSAGPADSDPHPAALGSLELSTAIFATARPSSLPFRSALLFPPASPRIAFIDPRRSSTGASPPTCNIDLHSRSAAPAMRRPTSTQVALWRSAHPISSRQPPGDHACPDARPA